MIKSMLEAIDNIYTYFTAEIGVGGNLEGIKKIYKGGANPHLILFPCIIIKPDLEERTVRWAAQAQGTSYERTFFVLIGVFDQSGDADVAWRTACDYAYKAMKELETSTDFRSLGYDVSYSGQIEYGTLEFGPDQIFCWGVTIPIQIKVKGTTS